MTLLCRPIGRGCWNLIVIELNAPLDFFKFRPEQRFTWGEPAVTLRIVEVRP